MAKNGKLRTDDDVINELIGFYEKYLVLKDPNVKMKWDPDMRGE